MADPWYDFLALPVAPLVLLLQSASLFVAARATRWAAGLACTGAIAAMFTYVATLDLDGEGANIGAGLLFLWLLVSLALLGAAAVRDLVAIARRRRD